MYFLPLYLLKITQNLFLRYKVQVPKFKGISVCTGMFVPLLDYLLFVHIQCIYIFFQDCVRQRQV